MKLDHYKKQSKALEAIVMKPLIHLTAKDLPELEDWEVGKEYKLEVIVRQRSLREDEEGLNASFEIRKVRSLKL